jgi:hypothetical protein
MKKTLLFLTFNFFAICLSYAQSEELNELTVDRPGIAESPFTVAPGMYQFEVGFDHYKRYNGRVSYLPVALFRTGISNGAELRITSKQLVDRLDGKSFVGVSPLSVGVKVHIIHQNEWIPETDILTNLVIPLGSSAVQPKNIGHEVLLLFQNDFYPNAAINYNIGYIWDGNKQEEIITGSFCFNYLPTSKVGLFAEYYTYIFDTWPGEQGVDAGITYLLRPKLQVDLSAGFSRLQKESNFFISSGFSIRLERKSDKRTLSHARVQSTRYPNRSMSQ